MLEIAAHAVLAACLLGGAATIAQVRERLRPDDFPRSSEQHVFRALLDLDARLIAIDPVTLADELARHGLLGAAGGKDYVGSLVGAVPTAANVEYHAGIVIEAAKLRALDTALERWRAQAADGRWTAGQIAEDAAVALAPLAVTDRLRLLRRSDLASIPDPVALVRDVLYERTLGALVGAYGTMKTFVLLDLALSVATGLSWQGHQVKQGDVVYIYAEGSGGIRRRVDAWMGAQSIDLDPPIWWVPRAIHLTVSSPGVGVPGRAAGRWIRPSLVVVDTLARCMIGDENSVEHMGRAIAGCDRIREQTGAAVLLAHHTGWSTERSRGSVALPAAVDTEILVERGEKDPDTGQVSHNDRITLKCTKMKDAIPFSPIRLEAFQVNLSIILRSRETERETEGVSLTEKMLMCLTALADNETLTGDAWMRAVGLKRPTFYRQVSTMIAKHYVKKVQDKYVLTEFGRMLL